uniref:Uncharacterized protein n=1 Tax=Sphaerodactylus townsendi TaxID=933632 RepID=A0ACB8FSV4_9SAUR
MDRPKIKPAVAAATAAAGRPAAGAGALYPAVETHFTTRCCMNYEPVMRVVTEKIDLSTIHGTTHDSMERFLDRYFEDPVVTSHWQSTGAQPKTTQMTLPQRESSDSESPERGEQARWPDKDVERKQLVNLDASNPGSLPPGAYGEDELVEPLNPPGAASLHHGEADDPEADDPDPFTLHGHHAALERAKREWQEAHEALIDDRVHHWFQLREEFDREREVLYRQL